MSRYFITMVFVSIVSLVATAHYANTRHLGNGAGLTFSTNPPVATNLQFTSSGFQEIIFR